MLDITRIPRSGDQVQRVPLGVALAIAEERTKLEEERVVMRQAYMDRIAERLRRRAGGRS